MIRRRTVLLAALLAAVLFAVAGGAAIYGKRAPEYDYLALALSWSPTYCASEAGRHNESECGPGRHYGFIVHGLWPEFENGWPEYCASNKDFVPNAVAARMRDLMPSKSLVIHEWKRHGTCSGLSPHDYFAATRTLFAKLRIPPRYRAPQGPIVITPDELASDFRAANPWLAPGMVSVRCGGRRSAARLGEVVFCFTRDLKPRPCGGNERQQCAAAELSLPPVR